MDFPAGSVSIAIPLASNFDREEEIQVTEAPSATELLERWRRGDREARDVLLVRMQDEMRLIARAALRRERRYHAAQTTAVVNDVCARLIKGRTVNATNRAEMRRLIAAVIRHQLIEDGRRRLSKKRGDGVVVGRLDPSIDIASDGGDQAPEQLLDLDAALEQLHADHARVALVVRCRGLLGMTISETARELGLTTGSVARDWAFGQAWLRAALINGTSAR
jgi:RNA polymerase sigma factor (TIGR02999 family)